MALVKCKECGHLVHPSVQICPSCGGAPTSSASCIAFISGCIGLVALYYLVKIFFLAKDL